MSQDRWLKRALEEMGPVPELPQDYRPHMDVSPAVLVWICLPVFVGVFAGLNFGSWSLAVGIVLAGVLIGFGPLFLYLYAKNARWVRIVGEKLVFDGPTSARQTLDSILPEIHKVSGLPGSDFLFEGLATLEDWSGAHGRGSQLCRVALSRLPDPPEMRRVGSLVRSIVEALALDGQTEEAARWVAWGRKYCPTEFVGRDWFACAILFARQGRNEDALASLNREPDPLSTPARGQLVAKAIRAFVTGIPEPLPLKEVRYLGSSWPELAAFFDEVERRMAAETGKATG